MVSNLAVTREPNPIYMHVLVVVLISILVAVVVLISRLTTTPGDVYRRLDSVQQSIDDSNTSDGAMVVMPQVVNSLQDAVVVLDQNGLVTAWSPGATELFGVERDAAIGYGVAFIMPADSRAGHTMAFTRAMESTERVSRLIRCNVLTRSQGEIEVQIRVWGSPGFGAVARFSKIKK